MAPRLARALGELVKEARHQHGLSQEHFVELVGVNRTTAQRMERGIACPSLALFVVASVALAVPPPELLARVLARMEAHDPPSSERQ